MSFPPDDAPPPLLLGEPLPGASAVPETFVQDLWAARRYRSGSLRTTRGDPVVVLDPGQPNTGHGPDFLMARLRIGEVVWAGDVEVHVASRTWQDHRHDRDPRYNRVVLHVTLYEDLWTGRLQRQDGTPLPEVCLYPHLEAPVRSLLYGFLRRDTSPLPCATGWRSVPEPVRRDWVRTLAEERLREKYGRLGERIGGPSDLADVLHEELFAALGYAENADPMRVLARRLPLHRLRPYEDPADLEALHFGLAGLLPRPADLLDADRATADYVMELHERFARLEPHVGEPRLTRSDWSFARLRPANHPVLRLAQAVAMVRAFLLHDPAALFFEDLLRPDPLKQLLRRLAVRPGAFWETHYTLLRASRRHDPTLGLPRRRRILANVVAPWLLLAARHAGHPLPFERVCALLEHLPPERDHVVRTFEDLGTKPRHLLDSQGLQQLYRTRCTPGHCLTCRIGQTLLEQP